MSSRNAALAPTLSAPAGGVGPQAATKPNCAKCKSNEFVVRLWHGPVKVWVCSKHYAVSSSEKLDATLKQRLTHKLPEPETFELRDVLVNRAARRRRSRA